MTHNPKTMCVSETKVEKIVDDKIKLLRADLVGNFNTHFKGLKKDLEFIKKQTTLTNSRTTKNETSIIDLQKTRATREVECPYKDRINNFESRLIAEDTLRDYLNAQEEKSDQDRQKFYTKMQGMGAIITVIVTILAFGEDIFKIFKNLLGS